MDYCERNKEDSLPDAGVCKFTSLPYRRDLPWPFLFSVTERGLVINKTARKKVERQDLGEALW